MLNRHLLATVFSITCFVLTCSNASADLVFSASQSGSDVVFSGSGSVDLTGLGTPDPLARPGRLQANEFFLIAPGLMNGNFDTYIATGSGPAIIGPGTSTFNADIGSGDAIGYDFAFNTVAVPTGYVSGTSLSGSMVFENETLASLGLAIGDYQWTAGSNQVSLNVSAVPEPSSTALLFALPILALTRRRRAVSI